MVMKEFREQRMRAIFSRKLTAQQMKKEHNFLYIDTLNLVVATWTIRKFHYESVFNLITRVCLV